VLTERLAAGPLPRASRYLLSMGGQVGAIVNGADCEVTLTLPNRHSSIEVRARLTRPLLSASRSADASASSHSGLASNRGEAVSRLW